MSSEYWKSLSTEEQLESMTKARDFLQKEATKLRNECSILALRLCGEDEDSFAPETKEVMDKWRPLVLDDSYEDGAPT